MLTKIFSWNKAFQLLLNTLLICLLPVKVMIIIILKYHILLVSVSFLLKRSSKRILKYDISKLNTKLYLILKHHILLVSVSFLLKRSSKRIRILKMIFVRHRNNIPSILFSCNVAISQIYFTFYYAYS
jgi:hypothetical protein